MLQTDVREYACGDMYVYALLHYTIETAKNAAQFEFFVCPWSFLTFFHLSSLFTYKHTQGAESGSMATYWAYFTTGWTVQGVFIAIQQSNFFFMAGLFYLVS